MLPLWLIDAVFAPSCTRSIRKFRYICRENFDNFLEDIHVNILRRKSKCQSTICYLISVGANSCFFSVLILIIGIILVHDNSRVKMIALIIFLVDIFYMFKYILPKCW